ncbi:hypothetical protein [uncultured Oscillibacter sp.]|uniref:hypothetical protein n=1 Tax=uncultured Oscillibacter sp. TaxID=876091 RepID=UPI0026234556|nr:hypothetical protein [uncultured Oscillibacter sp.]
MAEPVLLLGIRAFLNRIKRETAPATERFVAGAVFSQYPSFGLFPSLKLGNNPFDLSRFAVAAVYSGNRKTWHILLPAFPFGSNNALKFFLLTFSFKKK